MAEPVPISGAESGRVAFEETTHRSPRARGGRVSCLLLMIALGSGASLPLLGADSDPKSGGAQRRAYADDEILAMWEGRTVRSAPHRHYIFIDEEDIIEGTELPLYRIEASRYGSLRQLERMAQGDPGMAARIADLAPELARETEISRRADAAFYSRRSAGARRDTPDHPDVLVGPLMSLFNSRR